MWRSLATPPASVVFLQRPFGRARGMAPANQAAVLAAVAAHLLPGHMLEVFNASRGWRRDRELFGRAKVMLGPHGGAELNMLFSTPGTHVVEFTPMLRQARPAPNTRPCYLGLALACGHTYWAVDPVGPFSFTGRRHPIT